MKVLKIVGIVVVVIWLLFTTAATILFAKISYNNFLIHEATQLMPVFVDEPITIENGELQLDEFFEETPFLERIGDIKEGYLLDAIKYGTGRFEISPPIRSSDEIRKRFADLYANWPEKLKSYCEENIYKVCIVDSLHSSGRAISLEREGVFVILLNSQTLFQPPNVWATNAEVTAIKKDPKSKKRLAVVIENGIDVALTLENILIHEIGHAFGVSEKLTPNFEAVYEFPSKFPFFTETYDSYRMKPIRKNEDDHHFDKLTYYSETKMELDDYIDLLERLESTSFPTIYASRNELELFAEIFYSYIHCTIQKKPYQYKILERGKDPIIFENGISDERCAYERSFIENYFNN